MRGLEASIWKIPIPWGVLSKLIPATCFPLHHLYSSQVCLSTETKHQSCCHQQYGWGERPLKAIRNTGATTWWRMLYFFLTAAQGLWNRKKRKLNSLHYSLRTAHFPIRVYFSHFAENHSWSTIEMALGANKNIRFTCQNLYTTGLLGAPVFCKPYPSIYKGKNSSQVPWSPKQPGADKPICVALNKSFINVAMTFKV